LEDDDELVQQYAGYCLDRISLSVQLGRRQENPTSLELDAIKDMKAVQIRVFFLDGTFKTIPIEPWTTVKQMDEMLIAKLRINSGMPFCTFEVSTEDEERVPEPEDRVLDVTAMWQSQIEQEIAKKGKHAEMEEYKFIFKVRLFFDLDEDDVEEQDHITLAALQIQQELGDPSDTNRTALEQNLHKYLPGKYLGRGREGELAERIQKVYDKLRGYDALEAKLSYLDLVKSWEIYGSAYYFVEPGANASHRLPPEVVLAINSKAIMVVDPDSKEFLAKYDYPHIVTWGHSITSFVVVTGDVTKHTKVYFNTDQGKEMNDLVTCYVDALSKSLK
jgi:hypothetical protein